MKTIYALITITLLYSCGSDNLSNSNAKKIISKCLDIKPEQRTANFKIGKTTFRDKEYDNELLRKYVQMTEEGLMQMELLKEVNKGWNKGAREYEIKLTEKALPFMEQVPEKGSLVTAKTFKYEADEVLEVHETPATNTALVKVNFKATHVTPFAIFSSKDPSEFWIESLKFSKTSNGWKYCDNF